MKLRIRFVPALPWTLTLRVGRWRLGALAAVALATWLSWPNYLDLGIRMAPHSGGTPFWTHWQTGRLDYYDSWSTAFVLRLEGSTEPGVHGMPTPEAAFAQFDRWLAERGWRPTGPAVSDPILPESRLLAPEQTRHYCRHGTRDKVLLAIWPRDAYGWLNVVLVTSRPTLIEKIRRFGERRKESEEKQEAERK